MAYSMIPDIDKNLRGDGWVLDRTFLPFNIGDGHFLVQTRKNGGDIGETYTSILESFNDAVMVGRG